MRSRAKVLFAATMLIALLALPGAAQAAQVYAPVQSFSGPGSDPGQLDKPRRAAIEQSTGNLFVADSGNGRVQVFEPDGDFLTSFGEAELDAPFGVAIYESGGETEVYVSDPATNQILRYDSDEAATPSFSVDGSFTSPAQGAGQLKVGDFAAALAVDPTNGDLWVADRGDDRAQRYDSSGAFEIANDGSDSPEGAFTALLDIATDSNGRLYAVHARAGGEEEPNDLIENQPDGTPAKGQSYVERFSAGGAHQLTLSDLIRPAIVAVDLATDEVAVSADQNNVDDNGQPSLHLYDPSATKLYESRMGSATQYTTVHGLAWRSSDADVFAVNDVGYWGGGPNGSPSLNRFELADEPTASIDPPSNVTSTGADFFGTVNPGGHTTTARFEISSDGGANWKELDEIAVCEVSSPGDCTGDESVSFAVSGLAPNTEYSVRVVATSMIGSVSSGLESFFTGKSAPLAITDPVQATADSALLTGRVNPFGLETTYYFEYGTSPGVYTTAVPASEDAPAGSGTTIVTVEQEIDGLDPGTTYYFRLVATNSEGTVEGVERSLTTLTPGQHLPDWYREIGNFGAPTPGAGPAEFNEPRRLAVHDESGQVFVADMENDRIQVFAPEDSSATYLTEFGAGELDGPYGIAIDQDSGDVYVTSSASNRIVKYNRTEGNPPTFTVDPGFTSPALGGGVGEMGSFTSTLQINETTDQIWVADDGNDRVLAYGLDGAYVPGSAFNGSTSSLGPFTYLSDIAIDSNGAIVISRDAQVERFGSDGSHELTIGDFGGGPTSGVNVAINSFDQIVVAQGYSGYENLNISVWTNSTRVATIPAAPGFWGWTGVAIDQQDGRLYAGTGYAFGCCGRNGVRVLVPGSRPLVSLASVADISATTASFGGSVDPRGSSTTYRFEYRPAGSANWDLVPYPYGDVGDGHGDVSVTDMVTDLTPGTTYEVKLIAVSEVGSMSTAIDTFTTEQGAPTVTKLGAAPRSTTSARLNARLNPNGQATTYFFEYGPDASYGSSVPASEDGDGGSGTVQIVVSRELTGLSPDTEYHYRLVAVNPSGTTVGQDTTFRTRSNQEATPPLRGIELVNQPDKGNQDPNDVRMDASGDNVLWHTSGGAPGSSFGIGGFRSSRTLDSPQGWTTADYVPPREDMPAGMSGMGLFSGSSDLSSLIIRTFDGDGGTSLIRADADGRSKILADLPLDTAGGNPPGLFHTDDMEHVYYLSSAPLHPDVPSDTRMLYDFGVEPPALESVLPDGSIPHCGVSFAEFGQRYDTASADRSRLLFSVTPNSDCSEPGQLYMRDTETKETTRVSPPALRGLERGAAFVRFSEDGDEVLFTSAAPLRPDDINERRDVYLWAEGDGVDCLTCVVAEADVVGEVITTDDFGSIYFSSGRSLLPDAPNTPAGLYLIRSGAIQFVAPLQGALDDTEATAMHSADGERFVWLDASQQVTTDAINGPQYFMYDNASRSVECLSCSRFNQVTSSGASGVRGMQGPWPEKLRRSGLTLDGDALAFATTARLLASDINQSADIYEWHNGSLRLITDGETAYPTLDFYGVSDHGESILFQTAPPRPLTGFEQDFLSQIYVARKDGGIYAPIPRQPCEADDCQGPLIQAPPLGAPGSAALAGPGNQSGASRKGTPRKPCKARKRGLKASKAKTKSRVRCKGSKPNKGRNK